MTKSAKNKGTFHGLVVFLLFAGMLAGYYWVPLLGVVLEVGFWVYCGIFVRDG